MRFSNAAPLGMLSVIAVLIVCTTILSGCGTSNNDSQESVRVPAAVEADRESESTPTVLQDAKPAPAEPVPLEEVTEFATTSFKLSLPGKWSEEDENEENHWTYQRDDEMAQLLVSQMIPVRTMTDAELEDMMSKLIAIRQQAERDIAPGVTISEVSLEEKPGLRAAKYSVKGPFPSRNVSFIMIGQPDRILNCYLESPLMSEAEFEALSNSLHQSLHLVSDNAANE